MESFDQAGVDTRKDMLLLNNNSTKLMAEKGVIINAIADTTPFRKKLTDVGFYAEWKTKMGDEAWKLLEDVTGPIV